MPRFNIKSRRALLQKNSSRDGEDQARSFFLFRENRSIVHPLSGRMVMGKWATYDSSRMTGNQETSCWISRLREPIPWSRYLRFF
jgi:hypothetical protein